MKYITNINNFTISEPVINIKIEDAKHENILSVAGPYTIGERPTLICKAFGGRPSPSVTWWKDGHLVHEKYHRQNVK